MKKIARIMVLIGVLFLIGCSNSSVEKSREDSVVKGRVSDHLIVEDGIYYKKGSDKPYSGTVVSENNYWNQKRVYEDGKLVKRYREKIDGTVVDDLEYDSEGLLHGNLVRGGNKREYYHGVLYGNGSKKVGTGSVSVDFYDGVYNGKVIYQSPEGSEVSNYKNGIYTKDDIEPRTFQETKMVLGKKPIHFTGDLYYKNENNGASIKTYNKGDLVKERVYDSVGRKKVEKIYVDDKLVEERRYKTLREGKVSTVEEFHYNGDGRLEGKQLYSNLYGFSTYDDGKVYIEVSYNEGIPNGDVNLVDPITRKVLGKVGFYNKGEYSGIRRGRDAKKLYYKNGIAGDKSVLKEKADTFTIEMVGSDEDRDLVDGYTIAPTEDNFNSVTLSKYKNGEFQEEYLYIKGELRQKVYKDDEGIYIKNIYKNNGLLWEVVCYDEAGKLHGEKIFYDDEGNEVLMQIYNDGRFIEEIEGDY